MKYTYWVVTDRQNGGYMGKIFFSKGKAIQYATIHNYKEIEIREKTWTGFKVNQVLRLV